MPEEDDHMEPNANQEAQRRPSHIAYWIKERENQKGEWHPTPSTVMVLPVAEVSLPV